MEKTVKIESIEYVLQTRKVKQSKELRNKLDVAGYKAKETVALGDFQVLSVFTSLKSWSRKEPLTIVNFENLTDETHLDKLFDISQEVNTLKESEKN